MTSSSVAFVQEMCSKFVEMSWLTGAVNATPEGSVSSDGNFSVVLFGGAHTEFDRTAVGMLALRWLLDDDYEAFVACQSGPARLTREGFNEMRAFATRVCGNAEAVRAMYVYMVVNDLGKIKAVVETLRERSGVQDVDHDNLLLALLEENPEVSPSFANLSDEYQSLILEGLRAKWNGSQGIQAEDVAASWSGVADLSPKALDFYLLHLVCDVAGAAGHVKQNGSGVMNGPCWLGFKLLIQALELFKKGASPVQVRAEYLRLRGDLLGSDTSSPEGLALTVIGCQLRAFDRESGKWIKAAFHSLAEAERAILVECMGRDGLSNLGYLLYYSPALLANLISVAGKDKLPLGLSTMARLYHKLMVACRGRESRGVVKLMVDTVAKLAKDNWQELSESDFALGPVGGDYQAEIVPLVPINIDGFQKVSFEQLAGKKVGFVGIGGGSDCLQAALMASVFQQSGCEVSFVASVRTHKTQSQGPSGKIGENRSVDGHGGEPFPGVFSITADTTGTGRFLENLPATKFTTFLVMEEEGRTNEMLEWIIGQTDCQALVLVDTGGDALYSPEGAETDQVKATPDQDLRVLRAARQLSVPVWTCEVAVGVDAPADAESRLRDAEATFTRFTDAQAGEISHCYTEWRRRITKSTGSDFLGKTPLALQAALSGARGFTCIPIATSLVLDPRNPWVPFIPGQDAMAGFFVMTLESHLRAIRATDR